MIAFTIPLTDGWRYSQSRKCVGGFAVGFDDDSWITVSLSTLPAMSPGQVNWLRKRFELEAGEDCLRYRLCAKEMPCTVKVYLRGELLTALDAGTKLSLDVTNFVSLDDNLLALEINPDEKVSSERSLKFWLAAEFCH